MLSSINLQWLRWTWAREQCRLRKRLIEHDDFPWSICNQVDCARKLQYIGGVDISFFSSESDPNDTRACAAFVVLELQDSGALEMVWEDFEFVYMDQPYIAGFLAFREVSHLCRLLNRFCTARPGIKLDLILVDGNGILHPRGFGCASHFGVVSGMCTIGVAKNLHMIDGLDRGEIKKQVELVGQGGHVHLRGASGKIWGAALLPDPPSSVLPKRMTKEPKNPIFVSIGHRISLDTALNVVARCCTSRREPEPTRIADMRSREKVRQAKATRNLYDALTSLKRVRNDLTDSDLKPLRQALQDARSVVADKALLKPANKILAMFDTGSLATTDAANLERTYSSALDALLPAIGPPLRRRGGHGQLPLVGLAVACIAMILRRWAVR